MGNMTENRELKRCSKCGGLFPPTSEYFNKNKSKSSGLSSYCKQCSNAYNKQYYQKHKDYFSDYNKQYFSDYKKQNKGNYIYFVMENNEIMYVGSTAKDLKYRVKYQHLKGRSHLKNYFKKNTWTSIKYTELDFVENRDELYYIENLFISELEPILNQNKCNVDIDPDREDELVEEAYHILDHLDVYLKDYIVNY